MLILQNGLQSIQERTWVAWSLRVFSLQNFLYFRQRQWRLFGLWRLFVLPWYYTQRHLSSKSKIQLAASYPRKRLTLILEPCRHFSVNFCSLERPDRLDSHSKKKIYRITLQYSWHRSRSNHYISRVNFLCNKAFKFIFRNILTYLVGFSIWTMFKLMIKK